MDIKGIINKERWWPGHLLACKHNSSLDRIQSAVLEDEAALMKQVKLWSTACKEAEERVNDLCSSLDAIQESCMCAGINQEDGETIVSFIHQMHKRILELEKDRKRTPQLRRNRLEERIDKIEAKLECDIYDGIVYKAKCEESWSRIAELVMERGELDNHLANAEEKIKKQSERIAELEAQLSKMTQPKPIGKDGLGFEMYQCGCDTTLRGVENYCPECGAKLNWKGV